MRRSVLLLVLLLAVTSCSGDAGAPDGGRSPSPTATTSPGQATSGSATLSATGRSTTTLKLRIDSARSRLVTTPGEFRLVWFDTAGTVLAMGGKTFSGTRATSSSAAVSLAVTFGFTEGSSKKAFTSTKGECSVTLAATAARIEGTLLCAKISPVAGSGGPYRVTASFSAAA